MSYSNSVENINSAEYLARLGRTSVKLNKNHLTLPIMYQCIDSTYISILNNKLNINRVICRKIELSFSVTVVFATDIESKELYQH